MDLSPFSGQDLDLDLSLFILNLPTVWPRVLISDQEANFKAVAKDSSKIQEHKDTVKWLDGWRESDEKKY